jgi:hypothetical protein
MAEVRNEKTKTIRLTELNPKNYRLWAAQAESTFRVHGVLDIVLGREPHPNPARAISSTPSLSHDEANQDTVAQPLTAAQRKAIEKWEHKDSLAHQALLNCLQTNELTKVYQYTMAYEIWKRLADEYGRVSDLKRAKASAAFYSLQKQPDTSVQDHTNEFIRLQQELDYHRGSDIPPLTNTEVNLTFLKSLGEEWKPFQQSLGSRIHELPPAILYAEVEAFSESKLESERKPNIGQAYSTRFQQRQRGRFPPRRHHQHERPYDRPGHPPNNGNDFCNYCKRDGHTAEQCLKLEWHNTQAGGRETGERKDSGEIEWQMPSKSWNPSS